MVARSCALMSASARDADNFVSELTCHAVARDHLQRQRPCGLMMAALSCTLGALLLPRAMNYEIARLTHLSSRHHWLSMAVRACPCQIHTQLAVVSLLHHRRCLLHFRHRRARRRGGSARVLPLSYVQTDGALDAVAGGAALLMPLQILELPLVQHGHQRQTVHHAVRFVAVEMQRGPT
jgi:hypothetical protein